VNKQKEVQRKQREAKHPRPRVGDYNADYDFPLDLDQPTSELDELYANSKRRLEPSRQKSWGIIRYAPGSGNVCSDDAAGFDGWYFDKADALAIAKDWSVKFPQWVVALVTSDQIWFGNGDFATVRDRPLTNREFELSGKRVE